MKRLFLAGLASLLFVTAAVAQTGSWFVLAIVNDQQTYQRHERFQDEKACETFMGTKEFLADVHEFAKYVGQEYGNGAKVTIKCVTTEVKA